MQPSRCTSNFSGESACDIRFYVFYLQVSFDLLEKYLEQHSEASSCGNRISSFRENALFQDYHGLKSFRKVHK